MAAFSFGSLGSICYGIYCGIKDNTSYCEK